MIFDEILHASVYFDLIRISPELLFDLELVALCLNIDFEVGQLNFVLLQATCRLLENSKSGLFCLLSRSVSLSFFRHAKALGNLDEFKSGLIAKLCV